MEHRIIYSDASMIKGILNRNCNSSMDISFSLQQTNGTMFKMRSHTQTVQNICKQLGNVYLIQDNYITVFTDTQQLIATMVSIITHDQWNPMGMNYSKSNTATIQCETDTANIAMHYGIPKHIDGTRTIH